MFDIGGVESLVVFVVLTGVMAYGLYWLIRLAVNHGIQDAQLYGRVPRPTSEP